MENEKLIENLQMLSMSVIEPNDGQLDGLPKNPRSIKKKKFEKLKQNIEAYPEMLSWRSILVYPLDNGHYIIIGGNMRYRAMKELGHTDAPCIIIPKDTTVEQLQAYTIIDNNGFGEWDWDLLANEWNDEWLDNWGLDFEHEDSDYKADTSEDEGADATVESVKFSRCKRGEIWECGKHRLMCGDSTLRDDVAKLMGESRANIAFASPPYNAGCTPTEVAMKKSSKYKNDSDNKTTAEYADFLEYYLNNSLDFADYSFCNIQSLSANKISIIDVMYRLRDCFCDTLIWDKLHGQPAMAEKVLNSVFEYIHVFSRVNNSRSIGTKQFRGTIDNIVRISKQNDNEFSEEHNATFPLEFAMFFVKNFCDELDAVLDLFGGTGTTMIACERLNRRCFMMEYDERYCELIMQRFEKESGKRCEKLN